VISRNF